MTTDQLIILWKLQRMFFGRERFRIVSYVSPTVALQRNLGWQAARGSWIQFLDADDLLAPEKIEVQIAQAQKEAADVIYSD